MMVRSQIAQRFERFCGLHKSARVGKRDPISLFFPFACPECCADQGRYFRRPVRERLDDDVARASQIVTSLIAHSHYVAYITESELTERIDHPWIVFRLVEREREREDCQTWRIGAVFWCELAATSISSAPRRLEGPIEQSSDFGSQGRARINDERVMRAGDPRSKSTQLLS